MLTPLLLFAIGLLAMLGLVPLAGRGGRNRADIGAAVFLGYLGGGALVWRLTPARWPLSLWDTLAASVNARVYGHPVEHYAECLVVLMLVACAAGALLSGALAAARLRLPRA